MIETSLMSDDELAHLCSSWGVVFGPAWADATLSEAEKRIDQVLERVGLSTEENKEQVQRIAVDYLSRSFKRAAMIEYLLMRGSGSWTVMGEQRICISFCRYLLGIPADRQVSSFDADRMGRVVADYAKALGDPGLEELKRIRDEFSIDFFGVRLHSWESSRLPGLVSRLDLPIALKSSHSDDSSWDFILAEFEERKAGPYSVRVLGKELARSPSETLSSVGMSVWAENRIYVRREACEVIAHNKWHAALSISRGEKMRARRNPLSAVNLGLKEKVLKAMDARTEADLRRPGGDIVDWMVDGIVWNQVGTFLRRGHPGERQVKQPLSILTSDTGAPVNAIISVLADWMSGEGVPYSTIGWMADLARGDEGKAEAIYWMYLSDYWFLDTDDEFLPLTTEIAHALGVLAFVDGSRPDFARLESLIPEVQAELFRELGSLVDGLLGRVATIRFERGTRSRTFEEAQEEFKISWRRGFPRETELPESIEDHPDYSRSFWAWASSKYPEAHRAILAAIEALADELRASLLRWIAIVEPSAARDRSLREFVLRRYGEIGVISPSRSYDWRALIDRAAAKRGLDHESAARAERRLNELLSGEEMDIEIRYSGKPDPFVSCLQQLLLDIGSGGLLEPMRLGDMFPVDGDPAERMRAASDEVESLRDQLDSEMYPAIERLEVNDSVDREGMVEKAIDSLQLYDGRPLRGLIREIAHVEDPKLPLMSVSIPVCFGYMDWNTSQAIWRVNQEIRPDEFICQWTVDAETLEYIASLSLSDCVLR